MKDITKMKPFADWLLDKLLEKKFYPHDLSLNKKFTGSKLTDELNKIRGFIANNELEKFLKQALDESCKEDDVFKRGVDPKKFDGNVKKLYECDFVCDPNKVSDPMAISRCAKILDNLRMYSSDVRGSGPFGELNSILMSYAGAHESALSKLALKIKSVLAAPSGTKTDLIKSVDGFAEQLFNCRPYFSNRNKYKKLWGTNGLCMALDMHEEDGMEDFVKLLGMAKELDGPEGSAAWIKCKTRLDKAYKKFSEKIKASTAG